MNGRVAAAEKFSIFGDSFSLAKLRNRGATLSMFI